MWPSHYVTMLPSHFPIFTLYYLYTIVPSHYVPFTLLYLHTMCPLHFVAFTLCYLHTFCTVQVIYINCVQLHGHQNKEGNMQRVCVDQMFSQYGGDTYPVLFQPMGPWGLWMVVVVSGNPLMVFFFLSSFITARSTTRLGPNFLRFFFFFFANVRSARGVLALDCAMSGISTSESMCNVASFIATSLIFGAHTGPYAFCFPFKCLLASPQPKSQSGNITDSCCAGVPLW